MFTLFRMKLNNQDEKTIKKTVRALKPGLRNKISASINYAYLYLLLSMTAPTKLTL